MAKCPFLWLTESRLVVTPEGFVTIFFNRTVFEIRVGFGYPFPVKHYSEVAVCYPNGSRVHTMFEPEWWVKSDEALDSRIRSEPFDTVMQF